MKSTFKNLIIIQHPLVKKDVTILRDKKTNAEIFRAAVTRISNIMAVEISNSFSLKEVKVETPLEKTIGYKLQQDIVLIPVLRAGLGMVEGFLQLIPNAKLGHVGLERNETTLQPNSYYLKTPKNLKNSEVILLDPMLATGGSASAAINYLKKRGAKNIVFACLIAAPEGVDKLLKEHQDLIIFTSVLDRQLNKKGFILPGLGDAGDRTFGTL
ncbi:MAG: uracil phosphoribosyltransferase [Ignavibacteriota bacterium]|jgi:uracil phosphoribosyltransferase|nr:MAG: uracil phosphoribosyltransferase [Chlorobiota bacterium]MBE7478230.1 uracil phosphoribosyltransferase [Ignavibacteriales bacterium]MBL1121540.1 uracil phosphoribosyltransferase [Ignavibacteriota bacterium]MCC7093569.1 uracil phosphoribosyltransferase [Ignavibacteriaceae bacterium]MCE7855212.1 uracil phosphoribosyltransferase [Ignavibacteria bacterium CHB3]MEB2296902.1 uracil phosphoribosyltransferase [Ignavibacteria bacterium]